MTGDIPKHINRIRVDRETTPVEIRIWVDDASVEDAALDLAAELALSPDETRSKAPQFGNDIATKAVSKVLETVEEAYAPDVQSVVGVDTEYEVRL